MTEQRLLIAARAGDEAAFGQIVDAHRTGLYVHCFGTSRARAAESRTAERAVRAEARRGRCGVGLQTGSFVERLGEHGEQPAKRS
jgi:hypothetical protein